MRSRPIASCCGFRAIDRDFVLGEMGKAYFESGQLEQARRIWRQVSHKLYAGTLLRNNGLLEDAIDVLQEGIRLKPDDYGLHRNLILTLELAGKTDEALAAARRLLDLEPDNIFNVTRLAKAYLDHGDRAAAAEVAGRLFSADVAEKKTGRPSNAYGSMSGMPVWAMSMQFAWGGYGQGMARNNLDRGVQFFAENGLLGELEETLTAQLDAQPSNVVLRLTAIPLFSEQFGKPEVALRLLQELETGEFPLEHQFWLGQSTQRDHFRVQQYQLIASKPVLRDQRLAELEPRSAEELTRDETIELAVIRQAQGVTDKAIELLERAVKAGPDDPIALSALVDTLARAERFTDAEPHAQHLCELLGAERERTRAEMIERVRRDFVRTLPLRFQLRVTDQLLRDIAHKWSLGQSFVSDFTGFVQTMGYFRARLTLATIYAKTDRVELARDIWQELRPTSPADVDGWTMLAGVAQMYDQQDLAFDYYQRALQSAKVLAADPLLQRIYGGSLSQIWFGEEERIDSSFNKIVEAFSAHDKLVELYDFLRETDQASKARRVAEQYELYDQLKTLFRARFEQAGEEFRHTTDEKLHASVPYFMEACKLAELYDVTGDWPAARQVYEQYLADFPDELGLLTTLGEVAEQQSEFADAIAWEKKAVVAKERLARQARDWALRQVYMTPAIPQVLGGNDSSNWAWPQRWGKNAWWGYGSAPGGQFDRSSSWMRIAQLYLAQENPIAAADALERAIGLAGTNREDVAMQILELIRQWQLTDAMLPVLRSLAVYLPTNEQAQLTFAESLETNDRHDVAIEVYRRMLRRGVSDLSVLAQVRRRMGAVGGDTSEQAPATLASLVAEVESDPENASKRLRLAKAYYYSLDVDRALETLRVLEKTAPHLAGLHDLLIEIHTIRGDTDALIAALRTKINRSSDDGDRKKARARLAEELFTAGRTDEALDALKELADPKNPQSYQRVGMLLHYFGRHEEAVEQFELLGRSQNRGPYGSDESGMLLARTLVIKGDYAAAADKILESIDALARQSSQYGGMAAIYSMFESESNYFNQLGSLFVLAPELRDEIRDRLIQRYEANKDDPQAAKLLMQFYHRVGRSDLAEAILESLAGEGVSDQTLVTQLISRAVERREFDKAIAMIERFIERQPKPKLPPGVPPQFAGMMVLMSPRNVMLCQLGDVYWKMDDREKAFEVYKQIIDEELEETRIAYATICLMRDRVDEARTLVDEALAKQQVKSPNLLQFRALVAALDGEPDRMFDCLAKAIELGGGQGMSPFDFGEGGLGPELLVELAQQIGQFDRACDFVRQRIAKNPNQWEHHLLLANAYYEQGRIDEAFAALDEAAQVKSLQRQALQQRIQWSEGFATREELIPLYQELIGLAEKKVKRKSVLGRIFGGGSTNEQQIDTAPLRQRLGELLWELGKHEQAETVWTERLDMQNAASHITMGRRYYARDEFELARKCYKKALELDPENDAAHQALADLTFHDQHHTAALEHMKSVFLNHYQLGAPQRQSGDFFYDQHDRSGDFGSKLRPWAIEIAADPEVVKELSEAGSQDAFEQRLALSRLTGDWERLRCELRERRERFPYDPVVWALCCELQERSGDWAAAVQSREYLRQLNRTTLPQRREQLELVLAGRQIKDAAAGIKESDQNALAGTAMPVSPTGYSSYNYYPYGRSATGVDTSRLAALYVKLGQHQQAERLYLLSAESGLAESILPELASMMWGQGARERALDLLRLAVVMSDQANLVPQYAGMLAEAGRVDEATELLVRAYRGQSSREQYGSGFYAMMYGYYDSGDEQQFEDYQEDAIASTLHDILTRTEAREAVLARLNEQAEREPDDERLAKLILSLQIRAGRWVAASESLAARRSARPHDPALITQQIRVHLQRRDWPAALKTIDKLSAERPEMADALRILEAFARVMQDDCAGAANAVAPLLASARPQSPGVEPSQLWVVLAVAQDYDRLREALESARDRRTLDEFGQELLVRTCLIQGDYAAALRIALDNLWNDSAALSRECASYDALISAVLQVQAANAPVTPADERPQDRAALTLLTKGPAAGLAAFQSLVAAEPDNVDARRGLVLAASLADNLDVAIAANNELIEWLCVRRRQVWRPAVHEPLEQRAERFLEGAKSMGLDGSAILGMTMSFSSLVQEVVQSSAGNTDVPVTYEPLWRSHHHLHAGLLLQAERTRDLASLLESEARLAAAEEHADSGRGRRDYYYRRSVLGYADYDYDWRGDSEGAFTRDWRGALCTRLVGAQRLAALTDELERLGSRIPREMWFALSEGYAAAGRQQPAETWKQKAAAAALADLRATDAPQIASGDDRHIWRWRWYGRTNSGEVGAVRGRLHVALPDAHDDPAELPRSPLHGKPTAVWEFALLDPGTETSLVELAAVVGDGWGDTKTLWQLLEYYEAKQQPERVLALLDQGLGADELLRSPRLSDYISACYQTQDWSRIERVLDAAVEWNSMFKNDADLVRLTMLCHQGKQAEADALEQRLIERCRAEPENPHRLDQRLVGIATRQTRYYYRSHSQFGWSSGNAQAYGWPFGMAYSEDLGDVATLAAALGLPYAGDVKSEDLTLYRLYLAYMNHKLHGRAARIVDIELSRLPSSASRGQRAELLARKAGCLARAGDTEAARSAAEQAEAIWLAGAEARPADATPPQQLCALYASPAFGHDHAKAYDALQMAKRRDPSLDLSGLYEADCLYRQGRYAEAWERYERALNRGGIGVQSGTLYQAGISARECGHGDAAERLLRRALWCDPLHKLADRARELNHE
jgi:tetratricopeptide (TPR) repeat protein